MEYKMRRSKQQLPMEEAIELVRLRHNTQLSPSTK